MASIDNESIKQKDSDVETDPINTINVAKSPLCHVQGAIVQDTAELNRDETVAKEIEACYIKTWNVESFNLDHDYQKPHDHNSNSNDKSISLSLNGKDKYLEVNERKADLPSPTQCTEPPTTTYQAVGFPKEENHLSNSSSNSKVNGDNNISIGTSVDEIKDDFNNNRTENQSMPKSFIDEGNSIQSSRAFAISNPYWNLVENDTMTDGSSYDHNSRNLESFIHSLPVQQTIPTDIRKNEFTCYRPTGWYQLQNEDGIETRNQLSKSPFHVPVLPRRSKSLPNPPSSPPPPFTQPSPQINYRCLPKLMRHAINNTEVNPTPIQQKHSTNQLLSTLGTKASPLRLPKERINSRVNVRTDLVSQSSQPAINVQASEINEGKAQRNQYLAGISETNQEMEFNTLSSALGRSLSIPGIGNHYLHETMPYHKYVADLTKKNYPFYQPLSMLQKLQTNKQINNGKISVLHQQYDSTHEISSLLHNEPNAFPVSSMDNRTYLESQSSQPATNIQPSAIKEGKAKRNQSSVQILGTKYETILNISNPRENQSFYQTGSCDPPVQQTIPKSTLFQENPSHFHNTHNKVNSSDPYVIRKPPAILHEVQTYNETTSTLRPINDGKKSIPSQQKDSTNQISLRLPTKETLLRVPKEEINSSAESTNRLESQNNQPAMNVQPVANQPATNVQPSEAKEVKAPSNRYLAGISEFKVNRKSIFTSKMGQDVSMKLPDGVDLEVLNGKCSLLNISNCDSASLTIRWGVASTQETLPVEVFKVVANYVTHGLYVGIHGSSLLQVNIERTKKDEIKFERIDEHFFITLPENVSFEKHLIEPEEPQYQVLMEEISLDRVTLSNHPLKCKSDSCDYFASQQGLCWHCNNELQKWSSSFASAMQTSITASQSDIHHTASHFNISTTGQTKDTFNATLTCINCKAAKAANNDNGFCNNCFSSKK